MQSAMVGPSSTIGTWPSPGSRCSGTSGSTSKWRFQPRMSVRSVVPQKTVWGAPATSGE